jgi:hypothetical protein
MPAASPKSFEKYAGELKPHFQEITEISRSVVTR